MTEENELNILPKIPPEIEMEKKIVPEHPYCTNWPTNRNMESLKQREQRKGYAEAKAAEDRLRDIRGGQ